jgi:hypothetical protein
MITSCEDPSFSIDLVGNHCWSGWSWFLDIESTALSTINKQKKKKMIFNSRTSEHAVSRNCRENDGNKEKYLAFNQDATLYPRVSRALLTLQ